MQPAILYLKPAEYRRKTEGLIQWRQDHSISLFEWCYCTDHFILSRRSWWEYAKVESKVIKSKYIYVIFSGTLIRSPSKSLSVMQKSLFYFFYWSVLIFFLIPCLKNISGLFEVFPLSGYLSWQANRFWALQVCRESENPLFTSSSCVFVILNMFAYLIMHSATGYSQVCLNILSCLNSLHKFLQIFPQHQHRQMQKHLQIVSGPAYETNQNILWSMNSAHIPTLTVPPPSILFRPHEYSLYAPLDMFCLWSPQLPHSNIPAMPTAYAHSHTTHVNLFTLQCRPAVGMDEFTKW